MVAISCVQVGALELWLVQNDGHCCISVKHMPDSEDLIEKDNVRYLMNPFCYIDYI